jgi:hypothetical protein
LIWFGNISCLSKWGGGGSFLGQMIFICRPPRVEEGGGEGRHPVREADQGAPGQEREVLRRRGAARRQDIRREESLNTQRLL